MDQLKSEKNNAVILTVFKRIYKSRYPLTIWQEHEGKKITQLAAMNDLMEKAATFTVIPKEPQVPFEFRKALPFHFRENNLEMLFKLNLLEAKDHWLKFNLPKIIHFYYLRRQIRVPIPKSRKKELEIYNSQNRLLKRIRLIDISSSGMGIKIHQNHLFNFREGEVDKIANINQTTLNPPIKANIVYIKEIKEDLNPFKTFRLGMKFESLLGPEQFSEILQIPS